MQDDSSKESVVDNNKNNHKQLQLVTVIDKTNEERKNVENEKNQDHMLMGKYIRVGPVAIGPLSLSNKPQQHVKPQLAKPQLTEPQLAKPQLAAQPEQKFSIAPGIPMYHQPYASPTQAQLQFNLTPQIGGSPFPATNIQFIYPHHHQSYTFPSTLTLTPQAVIESASAHPTTFQASNFHPTPFPQTPIETINPSSPETFSHSYPTIHPHHILSHPPLASSSQTMPVRNLGPTTIQQTQHNRTQDSPIAITTSRPVTSFSNNVIDHNPLNLLINAIDVKQGTSQIKMAENNVPLLTRTAVAAATSSSSKENSISTCSETDFEVDTMKTLQPTTCSSTISYKSQGSLQQSFICTNNRISTPSLQESPVEECERSCNLTMKSSVLKDLPINEFKPGEQPMNPDEECLPKKTEAKLMKTRSSQNDEGKNKLFREVMMGEPSTSSNLRVPTKAQAKEKAQARWKSNSQVDNSSSELEVDNQRKDPPSPPPPSTFPPPIRSSSLDMDLVCTIRKYHCIIRKCPKVQVHFTHNELARHVVEAHKTRLQYYCLVCEQSLQSCLEYADHIESPHELKCRVETCGQLFEDYNSLQQHMVWIHIASSFACRAPRCNHTEVDISKMRRHYLDCISSKDSKKKKLKRNVDENLKAIHAEKKVKAEIQKKEELEQRHLFRFGNDLRHSGQVKSYKGQL